MTQTKIDPELQATIGNLPEMTQPNQPNQSELRLNICGITTGVLWGKNFDELTLNERSCVNGMAKDVEGYITANYTPNSEVDRKLKEAAIREVIRELNFIEATCRRGGYYAEGIRERITELTKPKEQA